MGGERADGSGKRPAVDDAADPPPARRPMRLAEKLLNRTRGGAPGAGGGGGTSRVGATGHHHTHERAPHKSGPVQTVRAAGGAGDTGVLTWMDVATPRDAHVDGAAGSEPAPGMLSAALQRVGSVKFFSGAAPQGSDAAPAGTRMHAAANHPSGAPNVATPRGRPFDALPMDWSLKTTAKFTSSTPMGWMAAAAGAAAAGAGVRAFAGASVRTPPAALTSATGTRVLTREGEAEGPGGSVEAAAASGSSSPEERLQRALYTFCYPSDPAPADLVQTLRRADGGRRWLERRLDGWSDALVSVYGALRTGQCAAFYVVYEERVVLFCAPGVGGGSAAEGGGGAGERAVNPSGTCPARRRGACGARHASTGFALVTNAATGRFRAALDEAEVPHEAIQSGEAAAAAAASRARAGIRHEEWAAVDPTDCEEWENDEPDALDHHGKPIVRSRHVASSQWTAADGTLIVRGAEAVHGLLCVMLEAAGGDPGGAPSAPRDAPLILAPVPFANATLRRAALKLGKSSQVAGSFPGLTGGGGGTRVVHTAECAGGGTPLPPWTVARLLEVLCEQHGDDLVGTFGTLGVSGPLNDAVAAATAADDAGDGDTAGDGGGGPMGGRHVAGASGGEDGERVDVVKGEGYYDDAERQRAAARMVLGRRGIERVQRFNGTYYIPWALYD